MTAEPFPHIKCEYSSRTEALRLLFTAKKIATWQYQHHDFMILPSSIKNSPSNVIYFPELNFTKIDNFWRRATKVIQHTPPIAEEILILETQQLLEKSSEKPTLESEINRYEQNLRELLNKIWDTLITLLPKQTMLLKRVTIFPTHYGTTKSFSLVTPKDHHLRIYLRLDMPFTENVLDALISGLIRHRLQTKHSFTWEETEAAKDAIILETSFNQFCPNYKTTLAATRTYQKSDLISISQRYLKRLGFAHTNQWGYRNEIIYFQDKMLEKLTRQEHQLLSNLIENPRNMLTFDEIADILWPNGEDYSLWAITKLIERMRKKLSQNGISPHLIQAKRKKGYSLYARPKSIQIDDKIF